MINWKCSKKDHDLIVAITERATALFGWSNADHRRCLMDVNACHCNGMELDLQRLLDAPEMDFAHDIGGIGRHIDRNTGKMRGPFVPRTAYANHMMKGEVWAH